MLQTNDVLCEDIHLVNTSFIAWRFQSKCSDRSYTNFKFVAVPRAFSSLNRSNHHLHTFQRVHRTVEQAPVDSLVVVRRLNFSLLEVSSVQVGFVARVVPPTAKMRSRAISIRPCVVVVAKRIESSSNILHHFSQLTQRLRTSFQHDTSKSLQHRRSTRPISSMRT